MPLWYASIVAEHTATRTGAGLFDVSHMGRFRISGPGAESLLDRLVTRRITDMQVGQVRYALVTNHSGGILDDVLVYRLVERESGGEYFQVVVNASNRRKIYTWIEANLQGADVELVDRTHETAMIAVQGPRAIELVDRLAAPGPGQLRYYHATEADLGGGPAIVSRTGYTGEDGAELIFPADLAVEIWDRLLSLGAAGVLPAGLGCRDTLRLEAGMPLYGHELTEEIDPLQAGLAFAVDLEGRDFPGRDAIARGQADRTRPIRVGLEIGGKRPAREGYQIFNRGQNVGYVTSGTFSPTLERPIAMAYVRPELATPGTELEVDIRGRHEMARVAKLPFYNRHRKGSTA